MEELCEAFIKNKYIIIVKSKKMTSIMRRLQEIQTDLWGPHNLISFSGKNYMVLLLDEFTHKI